jgi:hypothetical protein
MPVNILLSKISTASAIGETLPASRTADFPWLVGLGRVELPTSPLSGVRSSHLSYRPVGACPGGAGRDRTGDLLNANQALSQLSYSPIPFRALAGCPLGAVRKCNRGQLDAGTTEPVHGRLGNPSVLQVEIRCGLTTRTEAPMAVCGVERLSLTRATPYTQALRFPELHPRSLLERR